jgi:VWFA-related protein
METKKLNKRTLIPFLSIWILLLALYGFQSPQKQLKPLEHEVTVELVVVEVFVTDKAGNFVDNLTKEDFEIYEDGKQVKIQYFAVVKPEKETPKEIVSEKIIETEMPHRQNKMKLVILLDSINTNRIYLTRHWPEIQKMFNALFDKVEEIMIMELNRSSGARVIQPFTSDKNLLSGIVSEYQGDLWVDIERKFTERKIKELEIEKMKQDQTDRIISDPDDLIIAFKEEGLLEDMKQDQIQRIISNPDDLIDALKEEQKFFNKLRLSDSFSALLAAVNYISRFEGIKSVLLISDGFHLDRELMVGGGGASESFVKIFDPFKLFGGKKYFEQHEVFDKFLELINEEMIIFYGFSPKGIKPSFYEADSVSWKDMQDTESLFKEERRQWSRELYSVEKIAEETGGLYLDGEKKYENIVKEVGRDLTHFYDLSYTPPQRTRKTGYHKIDVKVKRPGLKVRFKKGYSDLSEEEKERRNIASAFLAPSFFKDVTFFCKTDFVSLRGENHQFWIRMHIPLDQFRSDQDMISPEKLVMMFGINEWGEQKVHFGEIEIPIKNAIEKGAKSLYHVFTASASKFKPGEYETRVILKQAGDRIGGWETSVKIPDIKRNISSRFINAIFCFLRKSEKSKLISFSVNKKDGSLQLSQYRLFPLVGEVIDKREKVALFLQIYNPEKIKEFAFEFSLYEDEGLTLNIPAEKIEWLMDKELKILNEVYRLDLKQVFPGDYQLCVKSSDGRIEKRIGIKVIH